MLRGLQSLSEKAHEQNIRRLQIVRTDQHTKSQRLNGVSECLYELAGQMECVGNYLIPACLAIDAMTDSARRWQAQACWNLPRSAGKCWINPQLRKEFASDLKVPPCAKI